MPELLAIGADGAHGGWLTVACYGESPEPGGPRQTTVKLVSSMAGIAALRGASSIPVAVDIPMGLLDSVAFRPCDLEARKLLERRASTVFAPPSRPLLGAVSYAEARASIQKLRKTDPQAKSLSAQAFALAPKIKDVDDWLQAHPGAQEWLYEVHPELSFRAMAGEILDDKKTAHGQVERLRLVLAEFPDAMQAIAASPLPARDAQLPDVLDAYAALDSALHVAAGDYEEVGDEPDSVGLIMRMVF